MAGSDAVPFNTNLVELIDDATTDKIVLSDSVLVPKRRLSPLTKSMWPFKPNTRADAAPFVSTLETVSPVFKTVPFRTRKTASPTVARQPLSDKNRLYVNPTAPEIVSAPVSVIVTGSANVTSVKPSAISALEIFNMSPKSASPSLTSNPPELVVVVRSVVPGLAVVSLTNW